MKKIGFVIFIATAIILGVANMPSVGQFAPDGLFVVGGDLLVANRASRELLRLSADGKRVEKQVKLASAVTDLAQGAESELWLTCEGVNGWLYKVDAEKLSVEEKYPSGANPSAVVFSKASGSLWVAQRFGNELWEVNPATGETVSRVAVGREPVDMLALDDKGVVLVANNMPETASTDECVAAQLDVVDVKLKSRVARIVLPNGSTDVKAVAADAAGEYAYVTHLLARYQLPTTQLDRGWMSTNALSIIDLKAMKWLTTVLLDTPQKGAANPWGVSVSEDGKQLVVAAAGSHEVAVIDREAMHQRLEMAMNGEQPTPSMKSWDNIPNDAGFLYGIREFIPTDGKGVRAVAVMGEKIVAANYYTAELSVIDRKTRIKQNNSFGSALVATEVGRGDMYFHDASLCYQSWQSCATCHPNGGRVDGLNWDLLNDGMGNPKNTKSLILSHETAPCMATGIRADAETAVRAGVKYILFAANVDEEVCNAMDAYLKAQKPIPSPYLEDGKLSESAERGKVIFDAECSYCHSGKHYTDYKQYSVAWTTGAAKSQKMDVPHLNECWRTAPYLYDGRSATMQEMLKVHGPRASHTLEELDDLAEYVLSL